MDNKNVKNELLPRLWQADAYTANTYEYLADIRAGKTVWLAANRIEGGACVVRCQDVFDEQIYRTLKTDHIEGTPEILEIYRADFDGVEHLIVVEEYVRGITLPRFLEINGLDELRIKSITYQLAGILDRLHRREPPIIHRDVKPDNILILGDGTVILTDFNIARHVSGEKSRDTLIMGTAGYAAPEQFGFAESDERTDVYGLGATVREMLESAGVSSSVLSNMVDKCTTIDPDDRFQSMREVMDYISNRNVAGENARKSTDAAADASAEKPRRSAETTADVSGENPRRSAETAATAGGAYAHMSAEPGGGKQMKDPYAFPGFRQGVWWHKVIAICGYLSMAYLGLGLKVEQVTNERALNLCRIALFLSFIAITFFSCDYKGMRSKVKWMRNFSVLGKICATILIDLIIFFLAVILSVTIIYLLGWEK